MLVALDVEVLKCIGQPTLLVEALHDGIYNVSYGPGIFPALVFDIVTFRANTIPNYVLWVQNIDWHITTKFCVSAYSTLKKLVLTRKSPKHLFQQPWPMDSKCLRGRNRLPPNTRTCLKGKRGRETKDLMVQVIIIIHHK